MAFEDDEKAGLRAELIRKAWRRRNAEIAGRLPYHSIYMERVSKRWPMLGWDEDLLCLIGDDGDSTHLVAMFGVAYAEELARESAIHDAALMVYGILKDINQGLNVQSISGLIDGVHELETLVETYKLDLNDVRREVENIRRLGRE